MNWITAFHDAGVPPPTYINPFTVLSAMIAALRKFSVFVADLRIDLYVAAKPKGTGE